MRRKARYPVNLAEESLGRLLVKAYWARVIEQCLHSNSGEVSFVGRLHRFKWQGYDHIKLVLQL